MLFLVMTVLRIGKTTGLIQGSPVLSVTINLNLADFQTRIEKVR